MREAVHTLLQETKTIAKIALVANEVQTTLMLSGVGHLLLSGDLWTEWNAATEDQVWVQASVLVDILSRIHFTDMSSEWAGFL